MDINSYQSYEEPRTANRQNTPIKSIQGWKNRRTDTQNEVINTLNKAAENRTASFEKTLMGYAPQNTTINTRNTETFQFGDIVDVVNPLHHLPIVGTIYRSMTEDELHPLSGIIGGAIYGGPVGALTGTANAISKIQTGKDIGEHALDIVMPSQSDSAPNKITMAKETPILKADNPPPHSDDVTTLTLATMPPRKI